MQGRKVSTKDVFLRENSGKKSDVSDMESIDLMAFRFLAREPLLGTLEMETELHSNSIC